MEKLIELLNEYETEKNLKSEIFGEKSEFIIVSKKFGFIKWLVESDKIERDRVDDSYENKFFGYTNYQILLMLLSIQDNSIDFLVSILR